MMQRQVKAQTNLKPYRYCGPGPGPVLTVASSNFSGEPGFGKGAPFWEDAVVVETVVSAISWMFRVVSRLEG